MFWAFAAITLIAILTITVSNHGPVRIAGGIVLAALLVIGLTQRLGQKEGPDIGQRGKPASPASVVAAMPLSLVQVDDLTLNGGGAPFEIRGHIANASNDTHLRSITLQITRRDCYEGALDPSGCVVIWQDQHWIQLAIPPRGERRFASALWARSGVPRVRGTIKDEFRLIAAAGEAVATP